MTDGSYQYSLRRSAPQWLHQPQSEQNGKLRVVRVAAVALTVGARNVVIGDTVGARGGTVGGRDLVPKQKVGLPK